MCELLSSGPAKQALVHAQSALPVAQPVWSRLSYAVRDSDLYLPPW